MSEGVTVGIAVRVGNGVFEGAVVAVRVGVSGTGFFSRDNFGISQTNTPIIAIAVTVPHSLGSLYHLLRLSCTN
jgi:hypothetical protein